MCRLGSFHGLQHCERPPPTPAMLPTNGALQESLLGATSTRSRRASCALILHVVVASVSGLLSGYNLCAISSILAPVEHSLQLCGTSSNGSCAAKQLAVSACAIGAMLGGVLGGVVADIFGRRTGLILVCVCCVLGAAAMSAASPGALATLFFIGRFLVGASAGGTGAIANTYIAEISPPALRGTLIGVNELALCTGCLLSYVAALTFGDDRWRWTCGMPGVAALAQLIVVIVMLEESPMWLAQRRHASPGDAGVGLDAARRVALKLGLGISFLDAEEAAGPHRATAQKDGGTTSSDHCRPLLLASGLAIAHALTAANTVLYYARDILQSAGVTEPMLANLAVGSIKFLGAALIMLIVDRCGRRPLLTGGAFVMGAGYVAIALSASPLVSLGGLLLMIFAWAATWAGIQWTVVAELLPQHARGLGIGVATAEYWLFSFLLSQTLETAFDAVGERAAFLAFGTATAGAACFVWLAVPETQGRHLR